MQSKHFPSADGEGTLSGMIVETNFKTGLAKKLLGLINGGSLSIKYGRTFTLGRYKT